MVSFFLRLRLQLRLRSHWSCSASASTLTSTLTFIFLFFSTLITLPSASASLSCSSSDVDVDGDGDGAGNPLHQQQQQQQRVPPSSVLDEPGLRAEYFADTALGNLQLVRFQQPIGYNTWPPLQHNNTMPQFDYFSVRWTGSLLAPVSGIYKFSCSTADTSNLYFWLDDHILCPNDTFILEQLPLNKGSWYDVRVEYRHIHPGDTSPVVISWGWTATQEQQQGEEEKEKEKEKENKHSQIELTPIPISYTRTSTEKLPSLCRFALRDRLYHSGWGTFINHDMLTHIFLPDSFALQIGIYDRWKNTLTQGLTASPVGSNPNIRPGYHSWNGSFYTSVTVTWDDLSLNITSTIVTKSQDLVILITPNNNDTVALSRFALVVFGYYEWSRVGWTRVSRISAPYMISAGHGTNTKVFQVYASIQPFPNDIMTQGTDTDTTQTRRDTSYNIQFPLNKGTFAVTTGSWYSLFECVSFVSSALSFELSSVDIIRSRYGDDIYDSYIAMQSVIAWNTMYDPHEGVITVVSKTWDFGYGYVLFDWDSYFASYMAAYAYTYNPTARDIAYNTIIQMTKSRAIQPDGTSFVPNYVSGAKKSRDRTEPQIGSRVMLDIFSWFGDVWFLELLYPDLLAWNTWMWIHRRNPPLQLISLGSDPDPNNPPGDVDNNLEAAKFESGLDNSPMYDEASFDSNYTHKMNLYDVGFNGMYVMDCDSLITLATSLGFHDDVLLLRERRYIISSSIQMHLWNPLSSVYQNRFTDLEHSNQPFSPHVSPTNFFPMLAGIPTINQVHQMLTRWLTNQTEMCLTDTCQGAGLPSITRSDASYHQQQYWRGRMWGPQLQLMYWCLSHPLYRSDPLVTAARVTMITQARTVLLREWREYGHVHENYNSEIGVGCDGPQSDPLYHWGALTGFMSFQEFVGAPNTPPVCCPDKQPHMVDTD